MGLRLEAQRGPVDVVVIDHMYSRDGSSWKLARMIVCLDDEPEEEDRAAWQ